MIRIYNSHIEQPEDRGVLLKDVLEDYSAEMYITNPKMQNYKHNKEKCVTLTATSYKEPPRVYQRHRGKNKGGIHTEKSPTLTSNSFEHNNHVVQKIDPKSRYLPEHITTPFVDPYNRKCIKGDKSTTLRTNSSNGNMWVGELREKSYCIDTNYYKNKKHRQLVGNELQWRKLTPVECERLQTLPDNYTAIGNYNGVEKQVSNTQRYRALGNGWTVEVIKHIYHNV